MMQGLRDQMESLPQGQASTQKLPQEKHQGTTIAEPLMEPTITFSIKTLFTKTGN